MDLCPPGYIQPIPQDAVTTDERAHVTSDQATIDSKSVTTFSGDVKIRQGNKMLEADSIRYDRDSELFDANGKVLYRDSTWQIEGQQARFNLNQQTGQIEQTTYNSREKIARGSAHQIVLKENHVMELHDATYTTCPEDNVAWLFTANKITLDDTNHQGYAEGATLQFQGVPFLVLPYIRFPIGDQRLSGFLFPGFGSSERHGTEFNIPFYWNIAPQYDATINPHYLSKRGWLLENEFRYLTSSATGQIDVNYLSKDKIYGDTRNRVTWNHSAQLQEGWSTAVSYNSVSDRDYINDFSNSLANTSITHLERRGELRYNSLKFESNIQVQDYQAITGSEAYKRRPQINLMTRLTGNDNQFNYEMNAELVRYDHADENRLIGQRLKLNPYISYPLVGRAGYFIPKVSLYHLAYNLDHITSATQPENPSVTVPVYSLNSGLYFDRNTSWNDTALLHTLEPRIFYLYTPFKDQSTLPNFDTAVTTFNELSMFSENRFSGNDRISDADQLAAAVSTRLYRQDNGYELFSATAGQLFYFKNREVTLPGEVTDSTNTRSSLFATLILSPHTLWRLRGDIQWNPDNNHTEVGNTRLQYRHDSDSVINFDYRFRRNELRTYGASSAWRFSPKWRAFAGHQFDIQNNHKLENVLGVQYDSCCWAVRLMGIERFNTTISSGTELLFDKAIYLSLELKGLSNFGQQNDLRTILQQSIYGYTD